MGDQIPTTTTTFKALKSIPLPWIFAAMIGGGGFAGGSFLGGRIDEDTLKAITLAVQDNGRRDETYVGGGGVTRQEFKSLRELVEGNAQQIEKLIGVTTETSKTMVRLLERSVSPRAP